jgi:hypothetical protein
MPPLVFLYLPPTETTAEPRGVPIEELMRDDRVVYESRPCIVRGFDPIGVVAPLVYLEDVETGERRIALLNDLLQHGTQYPSHVADVDRTVDEAESA